MLDLADGTSSSTSMRCRQPDGRPVRRGPLDPVFDFPRGSPYPSGAVKASDVTVIKLTSARFEDGNAGPIGQQLSDLVDQLSQHQLHLD